MNTLLWLLPVTALFGLFVVLFAGQRRRTARGTVETPAPGSPDSPVVGTPEKSHAKK